jgi:hypothetical protein
MYNWKDEQNRRAKTGGVTPMSQAEADAFELDLKTKGFI